MAGTSNSITTHNVLSGVLNADNVISGLVNTAFNPAYALVTQAGAQIVLFINSNDYKMYAQLKDKSGNVIYTSNIIDLPLETMVVDGRYDSNTKKLILVLDNRNEIEVPLEALISGLVNEDDLIANYYDKDEIDALLDGYWTKIELTQEDIDNWNAADAAFESELFDDGVISIEDSTEANINNTMNKSQLKIDLKGNTSQESTIGKNKLQYTLESLKSINTGGTWNNNVYTWNGITFTVNDDLSINVNGTATAACYLILNNSLSLTSGTEYILNGCPSGGNVSTYALRIYTGSSYESEVGAGKTFTYSSQDLVRANIFNGTTISNLVFKPMIRLSSVTDDTYEPYTGGNPAPNPDYPMSVNVVTGDNEIKVEGKNLLNKEDLLQGTFSPSTGGNNDVSSSTTTKVSTKLIDIGNITGKLIYSGSYFELIAFYESDNSYISYTSSNPSTIPANAKYCRIRFNNNNQELLVETLKALNIQLERGSTATTYEPYQSQTYPINLGSMELCKIGDYQDVIKRSSGKNLVNINGNSRSVTNNYYIVESLNKEITSDMVGKKYSFSFTLKVNTLPSGVGYYYNIGYGTTGMTAQIKSTGVTSPSATTFRAKIEDIEITQAMVGNNLYFRSMGYSTQQTFSYEFSEVMLNEGSTALPYEPYGKVWYKYGAIGKVVLDGSEEDWNTLREFVFRYPLNAIYPSSSSLLMDCLCDKYTRVSQSAIWNNYDYMISYNIINRQIVFRNIDTSTIDNWKTWLSSHNVELYYVLNTPTVTEITDTTLIEQLDNLEKAYSYDTQTNISQTNQDKPFILDINAIADNVNGLKLENENQEYKTNKVIELSSNSTDDEYPSAKCVYDIVGNIEAVLAAMDSGSGV